jgi:hypothetical protein
VKKHLVAILAGCVFQLLTISAHARPSFDGPWNITFVTQRGDCGPTYSYMIMIKNGAITQANLRKFRGSVRSNGAVRASVTVLDKHASGSGKLVGSSGRGSWNGYSGGARCAGYWTAQRAW